MPPPFIGFWDGYKITAVLIVLIMLYVWMRNRSSSATGFALKNPFKKKSGMFGCCPPWRIGKTDPYDHPVDLTVSLRCRKCGFPVNKNVCPHCDGCSNCRAEDKCGECQQFERQVTLNDRRPPCAVCGKKPCICVTATGKPVMREPSVARNGVYCDHAVNEIFS